MSAVNALAKEYAGLQKEPVEGFRVKLVVPDNMFYWEVAIFGPPDTVYQGGYFKARMRFPVDYPFSPPTFRFETKIFHPNVYEDGKLCISILHPPGDDPRSGETAAERWNPMQNVRTILLSVISLLNEPNTSSPANVTASIMYRRWKETKGEEKEYEDIVKNCVDKSKLEAAYDGIVVPTTLEEYVATSKPQLEPPAELIDLYEDEYDVDDDQYDYEEEADEEAGNVEDAPNQDNKSSDEGDETG